MKPARVVMRRNVLTEVKAKKVATLTRGITLSNVVGDLNAVGFYFIVSDQRDIVFSRHYVGRQRSQSGFRNVVSQIKNMRSNTGVVISTANESFSVLYVPLENMKFLTTSYGRGRLGKMLDRQHSTEFQNIEEVNRMLNDNFKFRAQKY